MNQFLVLGAGKMGAVLARDLVDSDENNQVTLADIDAGQLERVSKLIRSKRLIPVQADIEDDKRRQELFRGQDVAIGALLHRHSLLAMAESVRRGVHYVDIVGEWPVERLRFDEEARKKEITLLSGLGVSPGISNICVGRGVSLLDKTNKAVIFAGGNPVYPRPPLSYRIVYAVESLIGLYERKARILKDGREKEVKPLTGIESISFPPPFGDMECFYTDGLNSLIQTMAGRVEDELAQKTIRHRGHAQGIKVLRECGLFGQNPIRVGNQEVIPRQVLAALLDREMMLKDEKDVTLLRVVVEGEKAGQPVRHVFEMVDFYDEEKGFSSMGKTTCFPASIAAQMIVSGQITAKGSRFPEEIFEGNLFQSLINALRDRGVTLTHRTY
jgi:lysine 6-dehydrogenase